MIKTNNKNIYDKNKPKMNKNFTRFKKSWGRKRKVNKYPEKPILSDVKKYGNKKSCDLLRYKRNNGKTSSYETSITLREYSPQKYNV